jgi:hypothetical protein
VEANLAAAGAVASRTARGVGDWRLEEPGDEPGEARLGASKRVGREAHGAPGCADGKGLRGAGDGGADCVSGHASGGLVDVDNGQIEAKVGEVGGGRGGCHDAAARDGFGQQGDEFLAAFAAGGDEDHATFAGAGGNAATASIAPDRFEAVGAGEAGEVCLAFDDKD